MSTVAFPRSCVGTGQCLELLPEPGFQQLPGVTAGSIPPCWGVLVGGSSPGSLLELMQEHCLPLSERKQPEARYSLFDFIPRVFQLFPAMAAVCGRAESGEGHCTVVFYKRNLVNEYFIYLLVSCCLLWSQVTAMVGGGVSLHRAGSRATAVTLQVTSAGRERNLR